MNTKFTKKINLKRINDFIGSIKLKAFLKRESISLAEHFYSLTYDYSDNPKITKEIKEIICQINNSQLLMVREELIDSFKDSIDSLINILNFFKYLKNDSTLIRTQVPYDPNEGSYDYDEEDIFNEENVKELFVIINSILIDYPDLYRYYDDYFKSKYYDDYINMIESPIDYNKDLNHESGNYVLLLIRYLTKQKDLCLEIQVLLLDADLRNKLVIFCSMPGYNRYRNGRLDGQND